MTENYTKIISIGMHICYEEIKKNMKTEDDHTEEDYGDASIQVGMQRKKIRL